jgi:hypothetical protein
MPRVGTSDDTQADDLDAVEELAVGGLSERLLAAAGLGLAELEVACGRG